MEIPASLYYGRTWRGAAWHLTGLAAGYLARALCGVLLEPLTGGGERQAVADEVRTPLCRRCQARRPVPYD